MDDIAWEADQETLTTGFGRKFTATLRLLLLSAHYAGESMYGVPGKAEAAIGRMIREGRIIDVGEDDEDDEWETEEEWETDEEEQEDQVPMKRISG